MKPLIAERLTNGGKSILTHAKILPPPMDESQASEYLLKVKDIFDRREIQFWLTGGTLLGAVRDRRFIPWDTDIDLGVYERDAERILPAIEDMEECGLKVIRTNRTDNTFQVKCNLICIEFGSAQKYRIGMWRWGRFYEPFDVFSEFIHYSFLGTQFLVPAKYERYLQVHYSEGDNEDAWKTPNPDMNHARLFRLPKRHLRI